MKTVLDVSNLRVLFDTPRGVVQAVDEVSFKLHEGQTVGIVGESGCGKSVMCLALMGLVPSPPGRVETGRALFAERDLLTSSQADLRRLRGRAISLVFQDPNASLHPLMSIGSQMSEVLRYHERLKRREALVRCAEALEHVGIADPERRLAGYAHELSGGMRQRVLIAMALLCRPKILIADEPTTALDVTVQAQILDLLKDLQQRFGMAMLLVSHDLGVVSTVAHEVNVMYAGRLVEVAETKTLFRDPMHPYTLALMSSVPRLDDPTGQPLATIAGDPPDPTRTSEGCSFEPRCTYAVERCQNERPPLTFSRAADRYSIADTHLLGGHRAACYEMDAVAMRAPRGKRSEQP